ncbi:MAG: TonB-dependent receptor, partial [Pseudomonadota bacterium]
MIDQFLRAVLLLLLGVFPWVPALAQTAEPNYTLNIRSQPLDAAIVEFSAATRTQVSADAAILQGQQSAALSGSYTAGDALQELVADAGLAVFEIDSRTFALRYTASNPPPSGAVSAPALEIEEMVVYGTKQNLSLQDTQTSVELFTTEQIDEMVLFSLDDILLRTANVSMQNVQTGFSIRGISIGGTGGAGSGRTANVYVDGAPLSPNAQQGVQTLWDIEQVEILLGPQSTVQGRNALAGAIVMRSLDPTYEWTFRGRAQAASQETGKGSFALSGPLIEDQLAFRLAYDYQTYDAGVTEVETGIAQEFQDSHMLRGKLLIEPKALEKLRVEL